MLDQLPIELKFHIFEFFKNFSNLALTSRLFASEVRFYRDRQLRFSLRQISKGEKLEDDERDLLHRFRRSPRYDALVLETFGNRFFTLPIEFGFKVPQVSTLPPLEFGLLRYHFPGREVYNTSNLKEIESYLDRNLDAAVDSNKVHELDIFTHVDRVRSYLPYRNVVILSGEKIANRFLWSCTSLRSLTLPAGVTSIGHGFLSGCTSLTSLTLPARVTSIEGWFLSDCTSLRSLTIPAGVTSIENWFLSRCTSLTSLTIPAGVTTIGNWFLSGCTSLTSLTIPAGVTTIGNWFLCNCAFLTSLTYPAGITSIGHEFLCNCTSLITINTPDGPISKEAYNASHNVIITSNRSVM